MARVRGLHGDVLDGLLAEFGALVMRILRRIAAATANLLAGHSHVSVDDLAVIPAQWVEAVDGEVMPALAGVYRQAAAAVVDGLAAFGHDIEALRSPEGADFMAEARNRLVGIGDAVWEAARDELVEGMHAGEDISQLAARVRGVADVSQARATVIARTEVVAANNAASYAQALLLDDANMTKSWEATPGVGGVGCDERTRPTHCEADGQSVPLREPFEVGGFPLLFPGDPAGPVEEVAGCRCAPAYDFADGPVTASASGADFHLPGMHDQMSHAGGRAGHALSDALGALVPDDQDDDSLTLGGSRYLDWSNIGEGDVRTWEVGDDNGDPVQMGLQREDMRQLASALSITLLRDQAVPPNPDDRQSMLLASLLQAGQRDGVAFGNDEDVDDTDRYFDWSGRGEGGSFHVEVGANGETAQLELSPDEMAQFHAQLVRTLLADDQPVAEAAPVVAATDDRRHAAFCRNPLHPGPCKGHRQGPARKRQGGGPASATEGERKASRVIADNAEGRAFIKDHFGGWHDGLSRDEGKALSFWQSPGFGLMNGQLRGRDVKASAADLTRARKASGDLRAAIEKAPPLAEDLTVYRGLSADQFDLTPGAVVSDAGFNSFALTADGVSAVSQHGRPAVAKIRLPKGMKVGAGYTRELIGAPGTDYRVVAVKQGKVVEVEMEAVLP